MKTEIAYQISNQFSNIEVHKLKDYKNCYLIKKLFVKRKHRHKGIGSNLMNQIIEYISEDNSFFSLYVKCPRFEWKKKWFDRLGFTQFSNSILYVYMIKFISPNK